jgi:hypothetical protein
MKRAVVAVLGLLVCLVPQLAVAQNGLFIGTWKVNVAKSKYLLSEVPRSETLTFEPMGERFKVSLDGVNRQGRYHSESIGKFDNVDVLVVASPARPAAFTYAFRRIDDRTWDILIKVNGESRILVHNVVSDDGQTMTSTSTAVIKPSGQATLSDVVIYEKQKP